MPRIASITVLKSMLSIYRLKTLSDAADVTQLGLDIWLKRKDFITINVTNSVVLVIEVQKRCMMRLVETR